MSIFKGIKSQLALSRLQEEQVYEFILNELDAGIVRKGLMAKAMTLGEGSEVKIQGEYIKLRFQSLLDENTIMEAIKTVAGNSSIKNSRTKREKAAEPSLKSYEAKVKRQEDFALKPVEKGKHDNFWNSLASEFRDARKEDKDW